MEAGFIIGIAVDDAEETVMKAGPITAYDCSDSRWVLKWIPATAPSVDP